VTDIDVQGLCLHTDGFIRDVRAFGALLLAVAASVLKLYWIILLVFVRLSLHTCVLNDSAFCFADAVLRHVPLVHWRRNIIQAGSKKRICQISAC
jgi:hypothetical protein